MFRVANSVKQALDGASVRHQVLANNLANANTPQFKRFDVILKGANNRRKLPLSSTNNRHLSRTSGASSKYQVYQDKTTSLRNDGNNVDIEREMVLLLENQLYYQSMTEMLNRNLGLLRSVIGEGRR